MGTHKTHKLQIKSLQVMKTSLLVIELEFQEQPLMIVTPE